MNFIEKLQFLCDNFIGNDELFGVNHNVSKYNNRFIYIGHSSKIDNKSLIFCYTHSLGKLNDIVKILHNMKNPFKLILHNSDHSFNINHICIFEKIPLLQCVFTQNMNVIHEKVFPLPIGLANSQWNHGNTKIHSAIYKMPIEKTKEIYFNFNINTNKEKRNDCYNKLLEKGLEWNENLPYREYLIELKRHKYAICPEGNGIDTHRFWECLYMNTIPICLKNILTEHYKQYFPIIILNDWTELDTSKLVFSPINYTYLDMEYLKTQILTT